MHNPLVRCMHRDNYKNCRVHKRPWLLRWLGRPPCVFNNPFPPADGERTCAELEWPAVRDHVPRAPGPPPNPPPPPKQRSVDFKEVLRKYIDHVRLHEGATYVNDWIWHGKFTDEEWTALEHLAADAESRYAQYIAAQKNDES